MPPRVVLSDEAKARVVEMYRAGSSWNEIQREFHISAGYVDVILDEGMSEAERAKVSEAHKMRFTNRVHKRSGKRPLARPQHPIFSAKWVTTS